MNTNSQYTLKFNGVTIESGTRDACIALRAVSGDILHNPDGYVDQEQDWLFQWEREDPTCYARRMQLNNNFGIL